MRRILKDLKNARKENDYFIVMLSISDGSFDGFIKSKVPPNGERRCQRTERHVIRKAFEGEPRLSFRRLTIHMPFSSLTATLSARWDINIRDFDPTKSDPKTKD